ncbi:MAG: hypothetical protein OEZ43_17425 [Gammaproteobacteria bacterium]|nr:hypothetical protein [Gammaproteobacteria bacterium]
MLNKGIVIALLLLSGFIIYINAASLFEAYGSGPPYFSRTTNMDKWVNPLPTLAVLDIIFVIIAWLGARKFIKSKR